MSANIIAISDLNKVFVPRMGSEVHALSGVNLAIREGEFITVVGPSGCGKTTLLRVVAGLISSSAGDVELAGSPVTGPSKDIGIVFQSPILLPWRSVLHNVMLPAEILRMNRNEYEPRARELLEMVGLSEFFDKLPAELSGGMQQRAAIARALVHDPRILLMDEPFGALDALTRERMNIELQRIWAESGKTIMLITHSIPEAVFLADRVVVMTPRPGRIDRVIEVGIDRPRTLDSMSSARFGEVSQEIREIFDQRGYID